MIFLTGATGYVGRHLLRQLTARGLRVRCLVLPDDPWDPSRDFPVEVVRGDVTDPKGLEAHGRDVRVVVHSAALMLPNRAEAIRRVNEQGTANLVRAARSWGCRRIVYLSAVSAAYTTKNVYGESKLRAEALVSGSGVDYAILRPTMVYGPGGGLHFQKLVSLIDRIPLVFPVIGPGRARLQPVHVDDLVRAVELVLEDPRASGRTYAASGGTVVTFDGLVDAILKARCIRRVKVHAPLGICRLAATVLEPLLGPSVFSRDAILGINQDASLDHEDFRCSLGYDPIDLDSGLARVFGSPA